MKKNYLTIDFTADDEGVGPETASLFRLLISSGQTRRVAVRPGRVGTGWNWGAAGCAVCMCDYDDGEYYRSSMYYNKN